MCYRYNEIELTFDKIKARVKSTGDIFEVSDTTTIYPEHYDKSYNITEVEFLDIKENAFPKDDPDYWTRLEHKAAIAAMQGFLAGRMEDTYKRVAEFSINQAHALVEMMKETDR